MNDRALLKLRARTPISHDEEAAIREGIGAAFTEAANRTTIEMGRPLTTCTLLIDGMMACYKDLSDGQRQITQLHTPGDIVDLHSLTLKRLDHNIMTLTPCRLAPIPHDGLTALCERFPRLARVLWFNSNIDGAVHREWELSLGRRTAMARLAALFCELRLRLDLVGLCDDLSYALPLTQSDLATCVGLTPIHVNRTLMELRRRQLVTFKNKRVTIQNWPALIEVGEFDPAYLYLEQREI